MISRENSPVNPVTQKPLNVNEWRKKFIINLLRVSCVLGIIFIIGSSFNDRVFYISLYAGLLAITFIPVAYVLRAFASIFIIVAPGINSTLSWGPWGDASLFFLIAVLLGALLFDSFVDMIIFTLTTIFISIVAYLETAGIYQLRTAGAPETTPTAWLASIGDFFVLAVLIIIAIRQLKSVFIQSIQQLQDTLGNLTVSAAEKLNLEKNLLERTEALESRMAQLHAATTSARLVAETQDIPELLETSTNLLAEKFGYYHVGLFILDDKKRNAYLQSSSSARGKELIGEAFNLGTNRKNPFALAVEQNRPIITLDIDSNNFVADENFPLTRSRMTLPLAVRGSVIGILDLHSDQPRAFNTEDAEILQALTDLIAIAFDNVRLINETQNLVNQLEANTSIQTQRTWKKITSRQMPAYQYTPAGVRPIFTREKGDASQKGLKIPLVLYGQTIGNIKLKRKIHHADWSKREKLLVEKIADQVSLALENSRLVEEAQKSAARDQMIANISTRIRETLDIQSVARTAVSELQRVFDLKEAEIVIGSAQEISTTKETD